MRVCVRAYMPVCNCVSVFTAGSVRVYRCMRACVHGCRYGGQVMPYSELKLDMYVKDTRGIDCFNLLIIWNNLYDFYDFYLLCRSPYLFSEEKSFD